MTRKNSKAKVCAIIKGALLSMLFWLRYYFDMFIDKIFGFFHDSKKQQVCSADNPIILDSATTIARKIRKREVKVEEVVKAFINRIKEVNPILNAVVDNRFKEAIEEAKKIDKQIEIGEITDLDFREKPFLGVPFTSKESTAAEGLSFTFGIFARKGRKAKEDAEIVRLMKNAGGILLGVTNIPQLNMWQETMNPIYGLTRNPYNTTRNVGGSSGGEGSIIAAGGSPIGLGTDIGGSLRIPAFMCGIYGHKPTCNLINTRGLTFRTGKEKDTMVVPGPMTRYAEDIIPLLKVLLDENASKLKLDQRVDIESINIYYIDDPLDPTISAMREEMKECLKKVVDHFETILPQKPQKVGFNGTRYGGKLWRYSMTQEPMSNFVRDLTDRQTELNPVIEILKYICLNRNLALSSVYNMINRLLPAEKADWAEAEIKTLRKQILDKLGDNGVLLYPSAPWPASYHYTAFLRPWNFNLFAIWNAMKLPVTQVPLGLSSEGLPLGIQIVSAPYNDRLTIAVAKHLEKHLGGYVPPFKLEA
ncbi:fatty-acid amide hydrolase 2 [Coccinella septempunctata]|uniref:fatty-acid amide hydrolase 2 n=1 Tax=Coccinella septempunctata TaxID=41139 RepID=UPI001D0858A4|nr:fatty-acid amide hydrolase 2 [Coccinella septempunctata]